MDVICLDISGRLPSGQQLPEPVPQPLGAGAGGGGRVPGRVHQGGHPSPGQHRAGGQTVRVNSPDPVISSIYYANA